MMIPQGSKVGRKQETIQPATLSGSNKIASLPGLTTCDACGIKNKIIFLFDFWKKFIYLY